MCRSKGVKNREVGGNRGISNDAGLLDVGRDSDCRFGLILVVWHQRLDSSLGEVGALVCFRASLCVMGVVTTDDIIASASCVLVGGCWHEGVELAQNQWSVHSLGALKIFVKHIVSLVVCAGLLVVFNLFLIF